MKERFLRLVCNALLYVDVFVNKRTYLRHMKSSGFIVSDKTTCKQIHRVFRID